MIRHDARALTGVGRRAAKGALIGAVAGAAVFFGAVALLASVQSGAWAAVGGAMLVGALGGLWAAFSTVGASPAWEYSLGDPHAHAAAVGVHLPDEKSFERVRPALERFGIWVFDRDGHVVRRP